VSRRDAQRIGDVQAAIDAIAAHLHRGDLTDGLVFEAVRVRLIEIGEAVKQLPTDLLEHEPQIPWAEVAGMRDPARRALGLDGSPGSALCPGAGLGTPLPGDRLRR